MCVLRSGNKENWYILDTGGQNACVERELEGFNLYVVLWY
jgi:hypothetical protein